MYDVNDTIAAVSSPISEGRVLVRITGPKTVWTINQIFTPHQLSLRESPGAFKEVLSSSKKQLVRGRVISGRVAVDDELEIDALLYLFFSPNSYTGEDVGEIHINTNLAVTEALMGKLFKMGLRMAGPGEFTARAYLAGKMDLSQAEAVNEVVVSSNTIQLAAAEKLLCGRLAETATKIQAELMDCLSLIEAGLDFSGEDIEFISRSQAVERLSAIKGELERLLAGSISYESVIDLPAVGIAGAPNAGKSSLLNKLLGQERSIVSQQRKTTRDVLSGLLTLAHTRCVIFDCAGLILEPDNILDQLAHQAAIEALRKSSIVIFCVDISKEDWAKDLLLHQLVETKVLIAVATKCDLLKNALLTNRLGELSKLIATEILPVSSKTGSGIEMLRQTIDSKLLEVTLGTGFRREVADYASGVALMARHREAVIEAIENIKNAINEIQEGSDEVASMMMRTAYQDICGIESTTGGHVDEQILDRIFSRFCIGK